jgi:hypothetical protein
MLSYDIAKKNSSQFQSLTAMSEEEFDYLHNAYVVQWENFITCFTIDRKERIRPYRSRKDSQLPTTQDQLLFVLHYLKGNAIQEHHAATYGMTQPLANLWIHLLLELLYKTLKSLDHLPERRAATMKELLTKVSEVYIDGTERDIQRPADYEEQKEHFSGKKKPIK